jgi:hypothetical protein
MTPADPRSHGSTLPRRSPPRNSSPVPFGRVYLREPGEIESRYVSARERWAAHAPALIRAARDLEVASRTFHGLERADLSIRARKLRWRAEELLTDIAAAADAEARRLP